MALFSPYFLICFYLEVIKAPNKICFLRDLSKKYTLIFSGQSNRKAQSLLLWERMKKEKLHSSDSSPQLSYFFIWLSAFPETWNIGWLKTGFSDDKGKSECQTRTTSIMIFFPWLKDNLFSFQNLKYLDTNKLHPLFMSFLPLCISKKCSKTLCNVVFHY